MVEVKTEKGRLSEQQKYEQKRMTELGFSYEVIRSKEEVDLFIKRVKENSNG